MAYYTKGKTLDMTHREGTLSFLEYGFAATTTQLECRWVGGNMILIPHSSKESMILPEADKEWQASNISGCATWYLFRGFFWEGRSSGPSGSLSARRKTTFKARLVV